MSEQHAHVPIVPPVSTMREFTPRSVLLGVLMGVVTRGIVQAQAELILVLVGVFFGLAFAEIKIYLVFENPTYLLSLAAIAVIALVLVRVPLSETKKG